MLLDPFSFARPPRHLSCGVVRNLLSLVLGTEPLEPLGFPAWWENLPLLMSPSGPDPSLCCEVAVGGPQAASGWGGGRGPTPGPEGQGGLGPLTNGQ